MAAYLEKLSDWNWADDFFALHAGTIWDECGTSLVRSTNSLPLQIWRNVSAEFSLWAGQWVFNVFCPREFFSFCSNLFRECFSNVSQTLKWIVGWKRNPNKSASPPNVSLSECPEMALHHSCCNYTLSILPPLIRCIFISLILCVFNGDGMTPSKKTCQFKIYKWCNKYALFDDNGCVQSLLY